MLIYSKGYMTKRLKAAGVRKGEKDGAGEVSLEHLKYADLVRLYSKTFKVK